MLNSLYRSALVEPVKAGSMQQADVNSGVAAPQYQQPYVQQPMQQPIHEAMQQAMQGYQPSQAYQGFKGYMPFNDMWGQRPQRMGHGLFGNSLYGLNRSWF